MKTDPQWQRNSPWMLLHIVRLSRDQSDRASHDFPVTARLSCCIYG